MKYIIFLARVEIYLNHFLTTKKCVGSCIVGCTVDIKTNIPGRKVGEKLRLCLVAIFLRSVKNLLYIAVSLLGSKENTNGNMTYPTNV
jgi:hypothetical protein